MDRASHVEELDAIASGYDPSNPAEEFDYHLKRLHVGVLTPWMRGRRVLEMGCATGELTSLMRPHAEAYEVVEGSERNIEAARRRVPDARYWHGLWEEFAPTERYSDILCVCALEHVDDPVTVARDARGWLAHDGRFHVIVPNAESLHRHVGVAMGILPDITSLSDSDHRIGHRQVFTIDTLTAALREAGYRTVHWQGIFLKVLANRQMLDWDWELIRALDVVGRRFPAHCAEIYVCAEP